MKYKCKFCNCLIHNSIEQHEVGYVVGNTRVIETFHWLCFIQKLNNRRLKNE